jgi:hypothetical protein
MCAPGVQLEPIASCLVLLIVVAALEEHIPTLVQASVHAGKSSSYSLIELISIQ